MKKVSEMTVYQTETRKYWGYDTILRMALHPMNYAPTNTCYKEKEFNFRVVYKGINNGRWRYSCLGSNIRNGQIIENGDWSDALQWLVDGEE